MKRTCEALWRKRNRLSRIHSRDISLYRFVPFQSISGGGGRYRHSGHRDVTFTTSVPVDISRQRNVPSLLLVAPAMMGLIYPALVWSIHAVSPFALALTFLTPGVC